MEQNLDDKALSENIDGYPEEQELSSNDLSAVGALVRSNVLAQLGLSEKPLWEASTKQLLTTLQSSDISKRVAAAHALSDRPYDAFQSMYEEIIRELTEMALSDVTWQGQVAALRALGKLGGPGKSDRLNTILLICLRLPHENVRAAAAQAIGEVYSCETVQSKIDIYFALQEATFVSSWTIRAAALQAIGVLHLSKCLNRVVVELDDEDDSVRIEAIKAFACLEQERAIPRLEIIARNDHELLVRRAAIEALQQVERSEDNWQILAADEEHGARNIVFPSYLFPDFPSATETFDLSEERKLEQDANGKVIHLQPRAVIYRPSEIGIQRGRIPSTHYVEYRKRDRNYLPAIERTKVFTKRSKMLSMQVLRAGVPIGCIAMILITLIITCGHKLIPAEAYNPYPQLLLRSNVPLSVQHIVVQQGQPFSGKIHFTRSADSPNQFVCSPSNTNCMGSETTFYGKNVCVLQGDDYICTLPFKAPSKPGTYCSTWQVKNSKGVIGDINFSVQVKSPWRP